MRTQNLSSIAQSLHKLDNLEQIKKKSKSRRIGTLWPNSIPNAYPWSIYYIWVQSRMSAQILRKLELPDIFKQIQNPIKFQIEHQFAWKSYDWRVVTALLVYQI